MLIFHIHAAENVKKTWDGQIIAMKWVKLGKT